MASLNVPHRSLNIVHSQNSQLYTNGLKHNNYISAFSSSIKENPNDDGHTQADLSLQKSNLQIALPYPSSMPFRWDIELDPCLQLLKDKTDFQKKLKAYSNFYKKETRNVNWASINKKKEDLISLPTYVVDLAVHGDKNPFFNGKYDWFYTGGNLELVNIHDNPLLIYPHASNIVCMNINYYTEEKLKLNLEAPIYNIRGHNINNKTYLTLRNKNVIKVAQLDLKCRRLEVSTQVLYKSDARIGRNPAPYIDALLFDENRLISANVVYDVNIHDIEAKKITFKRTFDLSSGEKGDLCQLESVSNCLLVMGRDNLSLLDFRVSSSVNEKKKAFKEGYFQCNQLCAICMSALDDNFVYLASKHSVYKCDLREMDVVKTWTHLMDKSPIVIKTMIGNNIGDEYLFVASFDETVCIHVSAYNHLPFKINDISDTYNKLKLNHEFIVREDFEKRFKLSTAGMATHDSSLFTSNSIGDVFKHQILSDGSAAVDSDLKLKEYLDEIGYNPKQMQVTHVTDQMALRNILLNKQLDKKCLKRYEEPNSRLGKFLHPEKTFGRCDMAKIWESKPIGPLDDTGVEDGEKERIDTWLAQSVVGNFDTPEQMDID